MLSDLRFALRSFLGSKSFAVAAVLTLALGIGVCTSIFSVVNAVLIRPLPYHEPEQLTFIWERFLRLGLERISMSAPEYVEYRDRLHAFTAVAAFEALDTNLTGSGVPERVPAARVTANLFPVLGVQPRLGRTLMAEENEPGRDNVVVLSHGIWQRRFAADPAIQGKNVVLDGRSYTIVGVMPPGFEFPTRRLGSERLPFLQPAEIWIPLTLTPERLAARGARSLGAVARLQPGVSLEQATSEVEAVAADMKRQHPQDYPSEGWGASAMRMQEQLVAQTRPVLMMLLCVVGLVLLIACANVANLLLARAVARRREFGVRAAVGAKRWQILRQLSSENLALAFAGGILGLVLASASNHLFTALIGTRLAAGDTIALDGNVLAFTLLLSMLTSFIFGLAPALSGSKVDVNEVLKQGSRGSSPGSGSGRLRSTIVVVQFALALMLLIGASLVARSLWHLQNASPGFVADRVLTFKLALPEASYRGEQQIAAFYEQALARLTALPGIESAGASSLLPLSGAASDKAFGIEGRVERDINDLADEQFRVVSPDYFRTLRIPLLKGRFFTAADRKDAPGVAIINSALAARHFANTDPLGKRIFLNGDETNVRTIVGIVGDVRQGGRNMGTAPELYTSYLQEKQRSMSIVLRSETGPAAAAGAARREIAAMDSQLPVYELRAMDQVVADSLLLPRLSALLFGGFAALALALALIGIYSVTHYSVSQRTAEIGIRMALGARPNDVLLLVLRQGATWAAVGALVGLVGAFVLTKSIASLLHGIDGSDPGTFAGALALLAAAALLACYVPARRATSIDPMVALRAD